MDNLYIEKWHGKFDIKSGKTRCLVYSVWQHHSDKKQVKRISQWVFYPWGGHWEDCLPSVKDATKVDDIVYKCGDKHWYPLKAAEGLLTEEQQEELQFLLAYPERGWANYMKFKAR